MLFTSTTVLALTGLATAGSFRPSPRAGGTGYAMITVEASHGGAGNGLTNTSIQVPIGSNFIYTNETALSAVSTLYLTGITAGGVSDASCTPYKATDGTGSHGLAFSIGHPSFLSTNTVQVGSIVCEPLTNSTAGNGSGSGNGNGNGTTTVPTGTPTPSGTSPGPAVSSSVVPAAAAGGAQVPLMLSSLLLGAAGLVAAL